MTSDKKELIAKLDKIIEEAQRDKMVIMGDEEVSKVEKLSDVKSRVSKLPKLVRFETGVDWFDAKMGGFTEGSFINLAGESFGGKTTFALQIIGNICKHNPVLFFSFEMYERILIRKLKEFDEVQDNNLLMEQKRNDLTQIEMIIREQVKNGIRFIVIDSRMKITVNGFDKDYQKNSEISKRLSKVCQETGAILLLINQISEDDLKTGRLQLKGSGDQKYDSDVTLFIVVNEDKKTGIESRFMYCTKDRLGDGKKWKVEMPDINKQNSGVVETFYDMGPVL